MSKIHPIQLQKQPYEASLHINGNSYHLIFGRQINGWFLCIPNHHIGVELAHPSDNFWNQESLEASGLSVCEARSIAGVLKELMQYINT